jgi:hypothetical protein
MPWWAHRLAVEGLMWEQPWRGVPMFQVEAPEPIEVEQRPVLPDDDDGVFVGVRPDEVIR